MCKKGRGAAAKGFPLGGSCHHRKAVTDEGTHCNNLEIPSSIGAFPSSGPTGHLPPKGKGL